MAAIYLVRHGQASFGAADYDQLSVRGEQQAQLLGQWLKDCHLPVQKVYLGQAKRHLQTAQHCLAMTDNLSANAWQSLTGFNEFDHVEILNRYRPDLAEHSAMAQFLAASPQPRKAFQALFSAAVDRWLSGEYDHDYQQTWSAFQQATWQALAQVRAEAANARHIWVFTSGGTITAIVQQLLALDPQQAFAINWNLVNTGVTKLLFSGERLSLSYLNSHGHLEQQHQAELITYR
ncbi:MAG: histidine phosphatase family protein [Moraxellaceae bacterium]|nr:histidine phosphatase family protein [Moraxellaceae bacterium]MCP5177191.1 histidine phosphatase family protein [Moraxellaceae bacterium]